MRLFWWMCCGVLASCKGDDPGKQRPMDSGTTLGDCPAPGMALARTLTDSEQLPGEVAVGATGDFILQNSQAAFVITRPDAGSTYWYYGGAVADAVAMEMEAQLAVAVVLA